MALQVRPYVVAMNHVEGCTRRKCGPECKRTVDGWEVDIVVYRPNGELIREKKKISGSKTAAWRWGEERQSFLLVHGKETKKEEVPTLANFVEKFMSYSRSNNKPSTVYAKEWILEKHLVPALGHLRLDEIGPAEIEAYKAKTLEGGLVRAHARARKSPTSRVGAARKSLNNHLAVLRKLLNLAAEWGIIEHAPKVRGIVVPPPEFVFLTFDETGRFLRSASPEWKPFLVTALKTGLRVGELLALRWEDVDLVAGRIVVRRNLCAASGTEGTPKGGRTREVPLSDEAVAVLKAHRHLKGPHVFCEADGKRLTHSRVKDVVPATCRKAGLAKRLTTHDLRHTFASHLAMRGVALKAIQELLGHATIDMTMRYAHLSPDVRRDAVRLLDVTAAGDILETEAR